MRIITTNIFVLATLFALAVSGCEKSSVSSDVARSDAPTAEVQVAPEKAASAVVSEAGPHTGVCEDCEEAREFHYSPFFVSVPGGAHYHRITFKDVGLIRSDYTPEDPLLEVIAESISHEFLNRDQMLMSEVGYDQTLLDPENHKSCGDRNVYVDVWNRDETTWGFSLWSGCSDESNFAWEEVVEPPHPEDVEPPLYERVEPLAKEIHRALRTAEQTECFSKHC